MWRGPCFLAGLHCLALLQQVEAEAGFRGSSEGKCWPLRWLSRSEFPVSRKDTRPGHQHQRMRKRHFKNLTFYISITALQYYDVDHLDLWTFTRVHNNAYLDI